MSKQQIADAFTRNAPGAAGLDKMAGAGQGSQFRYSCVGTALGAHTFDQFAFFNKKIDTVILATTYALGTQTPSVASFTDLEVGEFIAFNPAQVRNANIVGANSADALASLEVRPVRFDPAGDEQSERIAASAYQTSGDFNDKRVQLPLDEILDGYTFLRVLVDAEAVAVTFKVTFTMGPRLDRRLNVSSAGPALVRSSGS